MKMTRTEYCIAQSIIAAVRNISSMYESDGVEDEICVGDTPIRIRDFVRENTTKWQRENACDLLNTLAGSEILSEANTL